jgi:hypothetical protein
MARTLIIKAARRGLGLALLALTAGCQEWMAEPVRVEQSYGQSVKTAMLNQIYDPERARHPEAMAPDGTSDSIKSIKVLQRAYQGDIGSPQRVRQQAQLNIQSGGSGGGGVGGNQGGGMQ